MSCRTPRHRALDVAVEEARLGLGAAVPEHRLRVAVDHRDPAGRAVAQDPAVGRVGQQALVEDRPHRPVGEALEREHLHVLAERVARPRRLDTSWHSPPNTASGFSCTCSTSWLTKNESAIPPTITSTTRIPPTMRQARRQPLLPDGGRSQPTCALGDAAPHAAGTSVGETQPCGPGGVPGSAPQPGAGVPGGAAGGGGGGSPPAGAPAGGGGGGGAPADPNPRSSSTPVPPVSPLTAPLSPVRWPAVGAPARMSGATAE